MTALFAAGGTGGHLYPAFAIADVLRARGDRVLFVGTRDRVESRLVPDAGYPLRTVAARPMPRRPTFALLWTILANAAGVVQSFGIVARERPDAVIATGGYVCVPVVVAARAVRALLRRRIRIALVEPNVVPGVANRVLRPLVDEIWDARTTGVPVRASLRHLPDRAHAAQWLGVDAGANTLLVFGGSQGARSLNDATLALLDAGALPSGWQVLHVTGDRDYARVRDAAGGRAIVRAYLDDPADAYAVADLVLARAGASTLAEIAAARLPAILVPYPHAAERHQSANAESAAASGGAVLIPDAEIARRLPAVLAELVAPGRLAQMRACIPERGSDATENVVARIDALVSRR